MADLPMITISIPTYNLGSYLNKTLESILHQTDQNFEIWLVDDASTDKTADTVAQFEQADRGFMRTILTPIKGYQRRETMRSSTPKVKLSFLSMAMTCWNQTTLR